MSTEKIMMKRAFSFVLMTIVAALLCSANAGSGQNTSQLNISEAELAADMPFKLLQIQADAQGRLNDMDSDVANASQNLSVTGLEGSGAREVLSRLLESNPNLFKAVTVSEEGIILVAECKDCQGGEGEDISSQEHIAHILKAKTPALSGEFLTVEGYNATAIAYPIFSPEGEFQGGISTTFEPDNMLNALVAPGLNETNYNNNYNFSYSFWAMQPDGLIIYDKDASQIGKNLFEDPLYQPFQSLLALGEKMVAERSGHGSYSFQVTEGDKTIVTKDVYWTTAGLHGRDWRLAITRIME
jgi:polar amino acid transport system substrate-binding protein